MLGTISGVDNQSFNGLLFLTLQQPARHAFLSDAVELQSDYSLQGDGPEEVCLIMGFACCKSYWGPLVDRLLEWGDEETKEGVRQEQANAAAASTHKTPPRPGIDKSSCC